MTSTLDQIFVLLKHWLVGCVPAALQPVAGVLLSVVGHHRLFPALFAITTVLERKGLGRIQNRIGPNRTGPFGILQPIADGIKSLTKEDIVPSSADSVVHFLAPIVLVVAVFMGFAVLPMGRNMALVNMDAGLLFFFAIGASTELSVFMAGWSSRNKYSLLGAMRAVAQMISYEVPLLLSSVAVVMITGSLSLTKIVDAQDQYTWGLPHWYIFTPWGLAGFLIYAIAATAETNRSPFDLPEGESELVAGYHTEYSGFKFALFFLGEYLGHVLHLRPRHHALPRRLVRAAPGPQLDPLLDLVLLEVDDVDLRLHLDARNPAPPAPGPADELRLEVLPAPHPPQPLRHRPLALPRRRLGAVGLLHGDPGPDLRGHGPP